MPKAKTPEEKLHSLRNLRDIQGSEGNWDQGEYMRGMYNGMELAVAILEDREPDYKDAPA